MSNKFTRKPLAVALGAAFTASLAFSPVTEAQASVFGMADLASGYTVTDGLLRNPDHPRSKGKEKDKEGKCGEGKCGEGKCGEEHKDGEGKCGEEHKDGEGKCGEGKCGEGKCGEGKDGEGKKKDHEGKCGEGKCGTA